MPLVTPEDKVVDCLTQLTEKGCGCLVIVASKKSNQLLGCFTDGDLRRALGAKGTNHDITQNNNLSYARWELHQYLQRYE